MTIDFPAATWHSVRHQSAARALCRGEQPVQDAHGAPRRDHSVQIICGSPMNLSGRNWPVTGHPSDDQSKHSCRAATGQRRL